MNLSKSLIPLLRTMGEALLTILCVAMCVLAVCSFLEGLLQ